MSTRAGLAIVAVSLLLYGMAVGWETEVETGINSGGIHRDEENMGGTSGKTAQTITTTNTNTQGSNMAFQRATFAGGCFWGMEKWYKSEFKNKIRNVAVGYIGGNIDNPSYEQVCTGRTQHAEAVTFEFDEGQVSYNDLVEYFFRVHDPTTKDRQGNDRGTQYRSAVFYHNDEQKKIAEDLIKRLDEKKFFGSKIVTEVAPAAKWWDAEQYHQAYLDHNPGGYCNHRPRKPFSW